MMRRQLREIALRRADLIDRAHNQRMALSDNRLWTSGPFMIVDNLLDIGRGKGVRNSVLQYAVPIFAAFLPNKTLRMASRSLMVWMTLKRIIKKIF